MYERGARNGGNGGLLRSVRRTAVVLLAIAVWALPVAAQTSKGTVSGVVRDPMGATINHASVTVTSQDNGEKRTTTTNAEGAYRVDAVNPGIYTLHITATGFSATDVRGLNVLPSLVTSYNAAMTVGQVSQTVTVEANGNGIDTENSTLSGTIGNQELVKVPMFTQNPVELVATMPGVQVVDQGLDLEGTAGNGFQIEVNGARPRGNNFMIDGQDINDVDVAGQAFQPTIPDSFQTVTVLSSVAPAEYGRGSGAIVNLVTRGGTNTIHGSVWDIYEGSGLDSLDGITRQGKPFAAGVNPKARYDIHQPGFTLGGPILKDKLFMFGAGQYSRFYGNETFGSVELPDAAGYSQLTAIGGSQVRLLQQYLGNGSYLTQFTRLNTANQIMISSRPGCLGGMHDRDGELPEAAGGVTEPGHAMGASGGLHLER